MADRKSVALVGFADGWKNVRSLPEDVEIWSLNNAEEVLDLPRIDRLFELHPRRDLVAQGTRWTRLKGELPYPVYTLEDFEDLPPSIRYPIEAILELVFENLYVGDEHAEYMTSSFAYMIAQAEAEDFEEVYVYGFEFGSDTEWRYQRFGAGLLVGWAMGRGSIVRFPEGISLLPKVLYGYMDYQMYSRQNFQQDYTWMTEALADWTGKMNQWHQYVEDRRVMLQKMKDDDPEFDTIMKEFEEGDQKRKDASQQVLMTSGVLQYIHICIDRLDAKDRGLELDNMLFRVDADGVKKPA